MNWNMERKKLGEMKPADYNPREIRPEALEGLQGSIARFGMMVPIIWNKRSGRIVGGHQRYKILMAQGVEETDVVVVDLDDNEEISLNITMNNPSARGVFTKSVVQLLEQSERTMKDEFAKVGLADMLNYLSRYRFDDDGESSSRDSNAVGRVKDGMCCPRCRSVWNRKTGEVVRRTGEAK